MTSQLVALEDEARPLVRPAGGACWLEEHPPIGETWPDRLTSDTVFVAFIDEVLAGYAVVVDGNRHITRVDQVFVTPAAREARLRRRVAGGRDRRTPANGVPVCSRARHSLEIATPRTSTSAPASRPA